MPDNLQIYPNDAYRSHLFTVRLWYEQLGECEREWRGKVEHVPTKEARYFREWPVLIAFLREVLHQESC